MAGGAELPIACVVGDLDTLRPLGLAGIPCAVVAPRGSPVRFSRFTHAAIDAQRSSLVEALLELARGWHEPPVLFYERDWTLELISANRDRLAQGYRFLVPDRRLVEQLVDKGGFQELAERLDLPVPRSRLVRATETTRPQLGDLEFPVVIKPVPYRDERWRRVASEQAGPERRMPEMLRALAAKSMRAESREGLSALLDRLLEAGVDLLVQELVPGPEGRIETYHAYVDREGRIAAEFTGRVIRTYPPEFGISTALTTTQTRDVAEAGREVLGKLGFRGVAMVEFKRSPEGGLRLLEVNPRFTRWLRLGAAGGVNLPAMVYADLTGRPRPKTGRARAGVTWCRPRQDAAAAAAHGMSLAAWLRWAARCELNSAFSRDDPAAYLGARLWRLLPRRARRVLDRGWFTRRCPGDP